MINPSISLFVKRKDTDGHTFLSKTAKNQQLFSTCKLLNFKRSALRSGVWFRALSRIERAVVDLTIKYVDNVKSSKLAHVLTGIIQKLEQTTESMINRLTQSIGIPLAQKLSNLGVNWGNLSAKRWASDLSFAVFLAIMQRHRYS